MRNIIQILLIIVAIKLGCSQRINANTPINVHDCNPSSSTPITESSMGPCFNTPGCEMPDCCGIISGTITNFSFNYTATIPMNTGTAQGYLTGVGIGPINNDPLILIRLLKIEAPNAIVAYDYTACDYTVCPQEIGKKYIFDGYFAIPTTAVTTLTVIANLVAEVKSDGNENELVLCFSIYARIINVDFIPSLISILKNPLLGVILLPGK